MKAKYLGTAKHDTKGRLIEMFFEYKGYEYSVIRFTHNAPSDAVPEYLQHKEAQEKIDNKILHKDDHAEPHNEDVKKAMDMFWNYVNGE